MGESRTGADHDSRGFQTFNKTVRAPVGVPRKGCSPLANGFDWATAEGAGLSAALPLRATPCVWRSKTATRARSASAIRLLSTSNPKDRHYPLNHIKEGQARYEVIDVHAVGICGAGVPVWLFIGRTERYWCVESAISAILPMARDHVRPVHFVGRKQMGCACSGLVMLLPHGFEGRGQNILSVRLKRFLQMCAQDNWSSRTARRRPITSTSCADNCTAPPQAVGADDAEVALRQRCDSQRSCDFLDGPFYGVPVVMTRTPATVILTLKADDRSARVVIPSGRGYYFDFGERAAARGG